MLACFFFLLSVSWKGEGEGEGCFFLIEFLPPSITVVLIALIWQLLLKARHVNCLLLHGRQKGLDLLPEPACSTDFLPELTRFANGPQRNLLWEEPKLLHSTEAEQGPASHMHVRHPHNHQGTGKESSQHTAWRRNSTVSSRHHAQHLRLYIPRPT